MKQCTVCNQHKELSKDSFYLSVKERDGFHHICRECSLNTFHKKEQGRSTAYCSAEGNVKAARKKNTETKLLSYMLGIKKCACCTQEKSLDSFYKNKRTTDKLTSWCIECTKKRYLVSKQDNVVKELNDNGNSRSYKAQDQRQGAST